MKIKDAQFLSQLFTTIFIFLLTSVAEGQIIQQEKVHIHTNKPNYNLGDTLWFKAYITQGARNVPTILSGSMYVDVIDEKDAVYRSIRLPVVDGTANGDLVFGDDCQAGIYRIRAYTQWMRNKSADYFFDKSFTVSNLYVKEAKVVSSTIYDMQEGNAQIITKLNYTDTEGKPFSGKVVRYKVISDHNTINNGSGKTDERGNVVISIPQGDRIIAKKTHIEAFLKVNANTEISKIVPLNVEYANTDVQFFPEGGYLINGVSSRVGFKAVGINGSSVKVSGKITDDAGKVLLNFSSAYAGMGSFEFSPQMGKVYKAQVVFPDQSEHTINLPVAANDKYVLSVSPTADDVAITVKAPASLKNSSKTLNLLVQSGGEQVFSSAVNVDQINSAITIKRNLFPAGIATVTLYENVSTPISERAFFVKNADSLDLKITADKPAYKKKSLVQIQVSPADIAGKLVNGNFSVSVVNEELVANGGDKESTILSSLLLSSDLKGYVENPNYYFTNRSAEVDKQLDDLMLTQGYRKFTLNDFHKPSPPSFAAEGMGITVSGIVKTLGNKPLPGARVTLISLNSAIMEDAKSDLNGKFKVEGMMINEGIRFSIQARTPKGGNRLEVTIDQPTVPEIGLNKNAPDYNDQQNQITRLQADPPAFKLDRTNRLKEVMIRAKKLESVKYTAQGQIQIPEGHADQSFVFTNPEMCASLGICLQGKIHGVMFLPLDSDNSVANYPHSRFFDPELNLQLIVPMDVYLDGRKVIDTAELADIFDNNSVDPSIIGKIEVVRTSLALMGMLQSSNGKRPKPSLLIMTKRHDKRDQLYNPNIAKFIPQGFSASREFYSPKYDIVTNESSFDFRSAIYWNPLLNSNKDEPLKFEFYTSDMEGDYRVTVEGIDEKGHIARQVFKFKVE